MRFENLASIALLAFGIPASLPAQITPAIYEVIAPLRVREAPTARSRSIGVLPKGSLVRAHVSREDHPPQTIDGKDGVWMVVGAGYVFSAFLLLADNSHRVSLYEERTSSCEYNKLKNTLACQKLRGVGAIRYYSLDKLKIIHRFYRNCNFRSQLRVHRSYSSIPRIPESDAWLTFHTLVIEKRSGKIVQITYRREPWECC